jgi:CubicO group peptidase (beta-lactamase class C family)
LEGIMRVATLRAASLACAVMASHRPAVRASAAFRIAGAFAVAVALTLAAVPAIGRSSDDFAAVDAYVQSTIDAWAVPGAAIGIVRDGQVIHLAAFGTATVDGRAMTTETPIVIGSVGKSITALAVRQLIEAGRLDVDSPVTRYLPWFRLAGPAATTNLITIGRLLGHTSGLSTADGQDPDWYEPGLTPTDVARGLTVVSLDRPVGTYEYSNLNYVLLGVVIETVTGQSYGDYVQEQVFGPLGMAHSYASLEAIPAPEGLASGHRYLYGVPVPFTEPYPTAIAPAGYQVSSVEDMARFVAALSNGGVYDGWDVVTGAALANADRTLTTDWQSIPASPGLTSNQSGSTLSTNADILVEPAGHFGVVILMNANPIQFLGLPAGAANIASGIARLSRGADPISAPPSVRLVYLVVDAVLVLLAILLIVHVARARTWSVRLDQSGQRGWFVARAIFADAALPLGVLIGVPLVIGATGSSPPGDVIAAWRFVFWTLPDIGVALLCLSIVPIAVGMLKVSRRIAQRSPGAPPVMLEGRPVQ